MTEKEYSIIRNEIELIKKKLAKIYKTLSKQESGKLSMADNKGGELSIANSGILSIKSDPFLPFYNSGLYNKNDVLPKREKDNE